MKKYVLKATALAIGALVGGSAVAAALDITTTVTLKEAVGDSTGAVTYAKELPHASLGSGNLLNFKTDIGFGVSNNQTRYIRIDLTNAKFTGTSISATPSRGVDVEIAGKVDFDTGADNAVGGGDDTANGAVALVQGGANDQAYAVFQITAGGDIAATEEVKIKLANVKVTSTGSNVTVRYSLHETATSAQGATSSNTALLAERFGNLAKFATGLAYTIESSPTSTASVEKTFKEFKTGGGYVAADKVTLGRIKFVPVAGVKASNGTADVTFAAMVDAGTKVVVAGDFNVRKGADDAAKKQAVFISSAGDGSCATGGGVVYSNTVPSATGAEFVTGATEVNDKDLCYVVDGTSQIPAAGPYKASISVVKVSGTSTATSFADKDLGKIVRDGTELYAPFATVYGSGTTNGNRVVLTSTHTGAPAAVQAIVISEDGTTCSGGPAEFSLPAGKQLFIDTSSICPTITAGKTRFGLKLIIAAPNSTISGVYNSYTYDPATAKVTDLTSYPLQRAGQ